MDTNDTPTPKDDAPSLDRLIIIRQGEVEGCATRNDTYEIYGQAKSKKLAKAWCAGFNAAQTFTKGTAELASRNLDKLPTI